MKPSTSLLKLSLCFASLSLFAFPALASQMAIATVSGTDTGVGVYNYDITLNNTGTTNIGTFWFSWVPGAGFLSPAPSAYGSPAGWTELTTNKGAGIQWTTNDPLASGDSLSGFEFTSTESPQQLLSTVTSGSFTEPATVFYVYSGKPFSDAGYSSTAAVTTTPEPSSFILLATGILGAAGALRNRKKFRGGIAAQAVV